MSVTLDDEYIDVPEAATRLGVSPSTIWRWIDQGRLAAYRFGPRRVRLKVADVNNCITPVRPAEPRKVWMITKSDAELRRGRSEEEREQMGRALEGLREAREMLRVRFAGIVLPPTHVIIDEMREARTRQLMGEDE